MPYIEKSRRTELDRQSIPDTAGELNYCISKLVLDYVQRHGLCYGQINEVTGVLACVSQEFYRRVAAPYEEMKISQSGDLEGFENLTRPFYGQEWNL